jgi:beta-N-acetylhexosaminidase
MKRGRAAIVVLAVLAGAQAFAPGDVAAKPAPAAHGWAHRTLARLTLRDKVAQMIGVRAFGLYQHRRSEDFQKLLDQVRRLKVGCVVIFESEVGSLPAQINALQQASDVPLLIAADMERGMNFRIRRGVVPLPSAMALGATRSEEDARFTGQVTAREGRALGVHWAFAPVADVNSNPANPIINVRSYGEDPELVGRMTAAFITGAHEGGLLATVKHYPGHGDTASDSHLQLATISGDRERLDRVELRPFRDAIAAGVDAVMLGHIAALALDPSGTPATLSAPMAGELRNGLGFQGLMVTDAMEMQGVRAAWTGEAAVRAVRAGADFVILPPDPDVAIQAIVREVRQGRLPESRIDESVARILAAKERLGLDRKRPSIRVPWRPWTVRRTSRALSTWRAVRSPSFATRAASCPCTPSSRCASSISSSPATRATTPSWAFRRPSSPRAGSRRRRSCSGRKSPRTRRRGSWPPPPASRT